MTTWDEFLDQGVGDEESGDLRDLVSELEAAEQEAVLAGDVEEAESLTAQIAAAEEAADQEEWADQDAEWARQSAVESEIDAEAAARDAGEWEETAGKEANMAQIAGESSLESVDEAIEEYTASDEALEEAAAIDAADTVEDAGI